MMEGWRRLEIANNIAPSEYRWRASNDLLIMLAVLPNPSALSAWFLHHIFSDKKLLEKIRCEVDNFTAPDGVVEISRTALTNMCPTLLSTWLEVLRYHGNMTLARDVVEQCEVGGYTLERGTVLLPSRCLAPRPATLGRGRR
jgi:cytochrome P450